jgi:hypothetical protein
LAARFSRVLRFGGGVFTNWMGEESFLLIFLWPQNLDAPKQPLVTVRNWSTAVEKYDESAAS